LSEGRDIGSRSTLAAIAAESGLDAQRAERWLAGQEGVNEVRVLRRRASELGIDTVPFLLINGAVGVRGSRSTSHLLENIAGASWFHRRKTRSVKEGNARPGATQAGNGQEASLRILSFVTGGNDGKEDAA
jgi:predicted DsbA family dithiol-disulfide isomerase